MFDGVRQYHARMVLKSLAATIVDLNISLQIYTLPVYHVSNHHPGIHTSVTFPLHQ
jgi:hypothetical protein